jgi:tetratricopeptide (TPR) repeat protein
VTLPPITLARSARPARAGLLLLLLSSSALSSPALAQMLAPTPAPGVTEVAESDALILEGLKLREQGKDSEALAVFVRAQELAPTPRALAQRALAEQALGQWAQAEAHLREALAATDDPWITRHRQALDGALAVIGDHLGYLQVNGGLAGAELRLDGQPAGTLPLAAPLRVVVGRPLLEVALAGYYPVRREITIKAGSLSTEIVELVALPQHPTVASAPGEAAPAAGSAQQTASDQPPAAKLKPIVFWTAAGVTAVLGGITLWSGLNASAKNDAYEAYARQPDATSDEALRGYDDALSAQTRTNVLLVSTGVVAAATAVVGLFFTDWGGAPGAETVRVTASSDGSGHHLYLDGRF